MYYKLTFIVDSQHYKFFEDAKLKIYADSLH